MRLDGKTGRWRLAVMLLVAIATGFLIGSVRSASRTHAVHAELTDAGRQLEREVVSLRTEIGRLRLELEELRGGASAPADEPEQGRSP